MVEWGSDNELPDHRKVIEIEKVFVVEGDEVVGFGFEEIEVFDGMMRGKAGERVVNAVVVASESVHARSFDVGTIGGRVDCASDGLDLGLVIQRAVSKRLVIAMTHVIGEKVGKPGAAAPGKGKD